MQYIFKYAPEGAVSVRVSKQDCNSIRFFNSKGEAWFNYAGWLSSGCTDWVTVAERPQEQRKTVHDVVHSFDEWPSEGNVRLYYSEDFRDWYSSVEHSIAPDGYYQVCTREEYEQVLAESKQEWTHEYGSANIKCRILATYGNECWVLNDCGNKVTEYLDSLKPIKSDLEEAANDYLSSECSKAFIDSFIAGANWQREQSQCK